MVRQIIHALRSGIIGALVLVVMGVAPEDTAAFRGRSPHSRPHFHAPPRQPYQPSYRPYYRPNYRPYSRYYRPHIYSFWGFGLYSYPYSPYSPYDYDYYAPYSPSPPYGSGEHRRFPAFPLPGFFAYPGALGKGEDLNESVLDAPPLP